MKSLSLDSPESTEHAQRRRGVVTTSQTIDPHSSQSSSSRVQFTINEEDSSRGECNSLRSLNNSSPSSPVHNRRLLSARNMRMSSVELPDDNEKSLSFLTLSLTCTNEGSPLTAYQPVRCSLQFQISTRRRTGSQAWLQGDSDRYFRSELVERQVYGQSGLFPKQLCY
uniref:Uncharacterized protein n=1 Tax=Cacopsylla melanoneura TaxID=428564 RepID=A0A8D8U5K1_9HEMI